MACVLRLDVAGHGVVEIEDITAQRIDFRNHVPCMVDR
jgi:hypothetical protein